MLSDKEKNANDAFKAFKNQKILTMKKLLEILACSERTVQRRLDNWKACTSYNRNGRYYTLPRIARFDGYGIWKYHDVFFSKHGNLKNTAVAVIKLSDAGLSAKELSEITGLSSHAFLSHFKSAPGITREKRQGVFVYFSSEPDEFVKQKKERENIALREIQADLPTDGDAIGILVELIKNPTDDIGKLTRRVRRKGIPVSTAKVANLLAYHGVRKKNSRFSTVEGH